MQSFKILYLLQAGDREVKIGVTKNVIARIAALQTGNPQPIKLIQAWHHPKATAIEAAVLSACKLSSTSGEWLALDPDRAVAIIEVVIGSFDVTHCKELVRSKPEAAYHDTGGCWHVTACPRWMKDITIFVTTATGKRFVGTFVGRVGFTLNENIARRMRERPHFWRILKDHSLSHETPR